MYHALTTESTNKLGGRVVSGYVVGLVFTAALMNEFFSIDAARTRMGFGVFAAYSTMMLSVIYAWKFVIFRQRCSRDTKEKRLYCLLAVMLPFLYWRCFLLPYSLATHILVSPIWMFTIPVVSFFRFDLERVKDKYASDNEYFKRSCIEIFVVFPIWSGFLVLVLWALNLVDNWYPNFGC